MEDEIDLRVYIRTLLRYWKKIVSLALLAAVLVGGVSFLLPPVYKATALVSVAPPRYTLSLDESPQGTIPVPARGYPDLALSDGVVSAVFDQVKDSLPTKVNTLSKFRSWLDAKAAADPGLLRLEVQGPDPDLAARVANTWAATLAAKAGELYGQDKANLADYEQRLQTAGSSLEAADKALTEFTANNTLVLLQAQLDTQRASLVDYLRRQHELDLFIQDDQELHTRLGELDPEAISSFTDDVIILLLSAQMLQNQPMPLQVQVDPSQSFSSQSVAEQLAVVDSLLNSLQAQQAEVQTQIATLEPEILRLQGELAEVQAQQTQLTREQSLAESQYLLLSNKLNAARMAAQETANLVQVVSTASVPTQSSSPQPFLNTVLGGLAALLVGSLLCLIWEWWRGENPVMDQVAISANGRSLPVLKEEPAAESARPLPAAGPPRRAKRSS